MNPPAQPQDEDPSGHRRPQADTPKQPLSSGEGVDSVIPALREQEERRKQVDEQ